MSPPAPVGRVCMLVFNRFEHDSRVLKEGAALVAAGYDVRLVAMGGEGLPGSEVREGIRITRVDSEPRTMALAQRLRGDRSAAPALGAPRSAPVAEAAPRSDRAPRPDAAAAPPEGILTRTLAAARPLAAAAYGSMVWWRFANAAYRAAVAEPADVVLAHDLNTLPVGVRAARRLGARLLYDSHEVFAELSAHSTVGRRRWLAVERRALTRVEAMWMSSPGHAQVFAANHGLPEPPIVRNIPAAHGDDAVDLHSELDLDRSLSIVLYIGGVNRHRPLEALIDAASELPGCAIVIVGPGVPEYADSLRARAISAEVSDRVRVVPPVPIDEVVRYSAGADLGVIHFLNSGLNNWHGLPNKVFEYIAAGLPVVASDFPQLRSVIDAHQVGVTYDPEEDGALVRAIGLVLSEPGRLQRLRAGAAAARERLTWSEEAENILDVLRGADTEFARAARSVPAATRSSGSANTRSNSTAAR